MGLFVITQPTIAHTPLSALPCSLSYNQLTGQIPSKWKLGSKKLDSRFQADLHYNYLTGGATQVCRSGRKLKPGSRLPYLSPSVVSCRHHPCRLGSFMPAYVRLCTPMYAYVRLPLAAGGQLSVWLVRCHTMPLVHCQLIVIVALCRPPCPNKTH